MSSYWLNVLSEYKQNRHWMFEEYDWQNILYYEDFIRNASNTINLNWNIISCRQYLSESFIKEFHDKVNWDLISLYQPITIQFAIKNIYVVNWALYIQNDFCNRISLRTLILYFDVIEERIMNYISICTGNNYDDLFTIYICKKRLHFWRKSIKFYNDKCKIIQNVWREVISNPTYKLCRNRLQREFNELILI